MMGAQAWYEIVLPPLMTLAVVVLAVLLLWVLRGRITEIAQQSGVRSVSAFGVDIQFAEQQAVAAYTKQGLGPPSQSDRAAIRDAATYLAPLAAQSRLLWVDDKPGGNLLERSTLLAWEVDVQTERTTQGAMDELTDSTQHYDLVISDWRRPGDTDALPAGIDLIRRVSALRRRPPVIFYHGFVEPEELAARRAWAEWNGAIGATGSPGELLRWTLLELARAALDDPREAQRSRRRRETA